MQPVIPWLRTNLALLVFFTSLASGAMGMLVTTASFVTEMQHVVIERGLMLGTHTRQIDKLQQNMVDVDKRFNDQKAYIQELRRTRDVADAVLEQRIAVLEAQVRFLADRTPTPQPLGHHK